MVELVSLVTVSEESVVFTERSLELSLTTTGAATVVVAFSDEGGTVVVVEFVIAVDSVRGEATEAVLSTVDTTVVVVSLSLVSTDVVLESLLAGWLVVTASVVES